MTTWLLLSVTVPFVVGNCHLDRAILTAVPPATVHVITISQCGPFTCWTRYVESDGKRLGEVRVCTGENGRLDVVPMPP